MQNIVYNVAGTLSNKVYILFTCLTNIAFENHVLDKSTQNHCSEISSSVRVMFLQYLGLATSWMSITKNLVAFEEQNFKKEGKDIKIVKKLFLFLKVCAFLRIRLMIF